ncbi:hypothetical protein N0V82_000037 [Gnomoniopsis sp. IMI 355080]|nr:hypothetical protein N0V82_000037 [Gnomoniopsis sp. IMI 355080]
MSDTTMSQTKQDLLTKAIEEVETCRSLLTIARRTSGDEVPQGDDAVKVICGFDKVSFYIRKSSVCQGSRFFATACQKFREIDTPKIELDPKRIDPDTLRHILKYLDAIEPFGKGWQLPENLDSVLNVYRQARYLEVEDLTDFIVSSVRHRTIRADTYLETRSKRWRDPEDFEKSWKQVLIDAQTVFSQVANDKVEEDCDAIREVYMEFLHKNHGLLIDLGKPFANFMRQMPDLAFVMMEDAYKNRDRGILAPLGFSTVCINCGSPIGAPRRDPFFIVVPSRKEEVKYICRKVACRLSVKRRDM